MSKGTTATRGTGAAGTIDVSPPAAKATDIRVLIVDDSEDDVLATIRELKRGGYSPSFERVDTAEAMMSALGSSHWDVIICDYIMPSFSGLAALEVFKASGLDLPFILVSGKVGEERAVEAMRAGATDYVMKDKLNRLVPAIRREVAEAKSRVEYRKAALSLKQSEERYQALAENYADVVWVTDMKGGVTYVSPSVTRLLGYRVEELMVHDIDLTPAPLKASMKAAAQALSAEQGAKADRVLDLAPVEEGLIVHDIELTPAPLKASMNAAAQAPGAGQGAKADSVLDMTPLELELRRKDGSTAWASVSLSFIPDSDGRPMETVAILHDITERKRAEEILRESEQRLKTLFEYAPDAYYMNDMEGKLVDGNSAAERLTGYKREELIGHSFLELDLLSADQIPKAAALMERNQHGHPTGPDEFVLKHKDGSLVNAEVNTYPATIDGQRLVLGAVRDITDRRRAEEAERESEARYRLLAENLKDVIWTMDANLKYTYMSTSVTHLRGYSVEEAMALSMEATLTPASLETVTRVMAEVEAKQGTGRENPPTSVTLELELICKDGSTVWTENGVTYQRDSEGQLAGYIGVSRDITERKRAEESRRESEERFKALFEYAPDGIYLNDLQGNILDANKSALEILGYTREEILGRNFLEVGLLSTDQIEKGLAALQSATAKLGSPEEPASHEFVANRRDGKKATIEIKTIPVKVNSKDVMIGIIRDVTENKRTEEALQRQERHFRALTESSSDVVVVLNKDGTARYVSPSVERMFGFTPEQTLGTGFAASTHPDEIQVATEGWVYLIEHPRAITHAERRVRHADGSWRYVEATSQNLLDDPAVQGIVINMRDITERKKTEEALRISEEKYRGLVENTNDLIYTTDAKGIITYMGPQITRYGFTPEETMSRSFFDFVAPEDRERLALDYVRTIETGQQFPSEFRIAGKDGNRHWLEDFGKPFRDESGNVIGVSGVLRDVTDRKKAQAALREQEVKYSTLVNQARDAIGIIQDGRWVFVNPPGARMFGYAVEEITGKPFTDIVSTASLDTVAEAYRTRLAGGENPPPYEATVRRKDGTPMTVEISGAPIQYDGRPAVMAIARDITERKKAEETIRESEKRYRLLAENVSDVIWVTDLNLRPLYTSPSIARLLGYSAEESMARRMEDSLTPASLKHAAETFTKILSLRESAAQEEFGTRPLELEFIRKDGTTIWTATTVSIMRDAQGHPNAIMGVLHNITERKKAEEAQRESEKRYRLLAENISDVLWVTDMNLQPVYVSPSVSRLLGPAEETALSGSIETSMTPASVKLAAENMARALAFKSAPEQDEAASQPVELEMKRQDGSTVWVSTSFSIIRDSDGRPIQLMGVLHDTTERNEAERTLRESEERLKVLFEYAPDVYCLSTPDGTVIDANKAAFELFGYQKEEVVGKTFMELGVVSPMQFEGNTTATLRGPNEPLEMAVNRKDGKKLAIEVKTFPVEVKGQTLLLSIARDITERKETLEAVRLSQEWFRNLVETTADWVWESRGEGFYSYSNPQVRNILGYEPEEILGKTPAVLTFPEEADRIYNIFSLAARTGESIRSLEHVFLHKNGYPVSLETSAVPFFVPGQALPGYRGITRDVTERQQAKNRLQQALNKLSRTMEGTVQSISRMVETKDPYTAGHQWRVTQLACAVAEEMGLADEAVEAVRIAGLLHDLGKIGIPSEILSKPGRLSETEFAIIKTHAQIGYDILKTVDFPWPIADIVLQHHERLNGTGYPRGLHAEEISLEAKILAVADVVEAMSSHRPYRPTIGTEKALEEIAKNSGTLYDSDAVYACLRLFSQKEFRFNEREI